MNYWDEHTIYQTTNLASALACLIFAILLLYMREYRRFLRRTPVYPERYIMARKILGIAFLIIAALTLSQILTNSSPKHDEFFPIMELVISSSQAMLFTGALLALYNSRPLRKNIILSNIIPAAFFLVLYIIFWEQPEVQRIVKMVFFAFYVLQLIVYTIVFFNKRRKYLDIIEDYFDDGKKFEIYSHKGITTLFLCSLAVGIAALASCFFNEQWQLSVFVASYTAYYFVVTMYFFNYAWHSQKIKDVTTPEDWSRTEDYINQL